MQETRPVTVLLPSGAQMGLASMVLKDVEVLAAERASLSIGLSSQLNSHRFRDSNLLSTSSGSTLQKFVWLSWFYVWLVFDSAGFSLQVCC
jgi:hypothetical protein